MLHYAALNAMLQSPRCDASRGTGDQCNSIQGFTTPQQIYDCPHYVLEMPGEGRE